MTKPRVAPALQTLPLSELLDEAMRRTRRHLGDIYLPLVIPIALAFGLLTVTQLLLFKTFLGGAMPDPGAAMGTTCGVIALALGVSLLRAFIYAAVMVAAVHAVAGRPISAGRSLRTLFTPAGFGTLLLVLLFVGISYTCCFLPVLFVAPLLSLTIPAMVEEGRTGMAAISRSSELTLYRPDRRFLPAPLLKAFLVLLVTVLFSFSVEVVVSLPFTAAQQWGLIRRILEGGLVTPDQAVSWLQVPAALASSLAGGLAWTYASFALALLFFDLRNRKEGPDLEAAVDEIERERRGVGSR